MTQWVRNLVAGTAVMLGSRIEPFKTFEVRDADRSPSFAPTERWKAEVAPSSAAFRPARPRKR
jgi:hypothetical protein